MLTNDHWSWRAVFYHLFPLGCLGAPIRNDFNAVPADRLSALDEWIDHFERLGINALLLGPVFESSAHGYDTADLFKVDRRLGDEVAFTDFSRELHRRGIRLVLDAVFHHTGCDFWAFRDVRDRGRDSRYCDWYHLDFSRRSPCGEPFHYKGWAGNYDLAKLNLKNAAVRKHLFEAVSSWIEHFDIDGLRLDVADGLDSDFIHELSEHCRRIKPDFWLMGEVVHGDYRNWARPGALASTTNYEAYKGLWSSLNDRNYFEIAYSLNREFGAEGIYRGIPLYNFVDNHDVSRAASILREPAHLYPLYALLMTMPGVPSIYYGSEFGIEACKQRGTDAPLRPALDIRMLRRSGRHPDLCDAIGRLISLRHQHRALQVGDYTQLHVAAEQFAFSRR
ncbi:MAG TPA: alpha-amylase family glycosyl hydrolase, partial [Candidatus Binataceae bacterium]|nr:alpha-amylase family glycosyl hydrolase [Candidatus Binataceae bacterium]